MNEVIEEMDGIKKNENNPVLAALSWAHVLLLSGCLYVLTAAVLNMPQKEAARFLAGCLWLIIPTVSGWIFIRRLRTLAAYLLCSAAVCALLWALTSSVLTAALSVFLFLVRCSARIKKGRIRRALMDMPAETGAQLSVELWEIPTFLDEPNPVHFAVFALCYAGILPTGQYAYLSWIFFLLLAEVFVCFIYNYLGNMWDFIRRNQKIANLPAAAIQKVSRVLLLMAVILLSLAVFPSVLYGREPLIGWLQNIRALPAPPPEDFSEMMTGIPNDGMDFGALAEPHAPPPAWLTFLSDVLMYLCAAAAILILLIVIYHICRNAARYFAQDEEDTIVFLGTEERKMLRPEKQARKSAREKWGSPDQRIRRFYKKTLRRTLKQTPAGWETPEELEQKAGLEPTRPNENLHTLYEKARYSASGCSPADARELLAKQRDAG